jgi:hypothetical protein
MKQKDKSSYDPQTHGIPYGQDYLISRRMKRKGWFFDPDSGGVKIPDAVKIRTGSRIQKYADENFSGKYIRLDIHFHGQFCYIDAYTEPEIPLGLPPSNLPETQEEYIERLRNTPTHLCRLRFFGDEDKWGFAFYSYAGEKYEMSVFPDGEFTGKPEDAFQVSAEAYL